MPKRLVHSSFWCLTVAGLLSIALGEVLAGDHPAELHYATIPLTPDDSSRIGFTGLGMDSTGNTLAFGGYSVGAVLTLERATGGRAVREVPLAKTAGQVLSGELGRFFFVGAFRDQSLVSFGLGRLDLASGLVERGPRTDSAHFAVDRRGDIVVFQKGDDQAPEAIRYFVQQFSSDDVPDDITARGASTITAGSNAVCMTSSAMDPLLSADGGIVLLFTGADLDGAGGVGCSLFMYEQNVGEWRRIINLPEHVYPDLPRLDDAGRLLSFIAIEDRGGGRIGARPVLISIPNRQSIELPAMLNDYPAFDSVITRDGRFLVISTQADPLKTNSDHNMEIFILRLSDMTFTQVTNTSGGLLSTPGGCASLLPVAAEDGSVLLFRMPVDSVGSCRLDGPMRDDRTGFALRRARAVRRRLGDSAPRLLVSGDLLIRRGSAVDLAIEFSDPDDDPVTIFAQEVGATSLPEGAELQMISAGNARLIWKTAAAAVGGHVIRIAAFSEGGALTTHDSHVTLRQPCEGDCDYDGTVLVSEVISAVGAALGTEDVSICLAADLNGDERITIEELVRSVSTVLDGC